MNKMEQSKEAKLKAIEEMMELMDDLEMEEMEESDSEFLKPIKDKQMKKVTVMSDDEEGLQEGLSKAEKLLKMYKDME